MNTGSPNLPAGDSPLRQHCTQFATHRLSRLQHATRSCNATGCSSTCRALPDQCRVGNLVAAVATHTGKAARRRGWPAIPQVRAPGSLRDRRHRSVGQREDLCHDLRRSHGRRTLSMPDVAATQGPAKENGSQPLATFRTFASDLAVRDSQDLMAYPFFSLAKSRRVQPIDYRVGTVSVRVEGTLEHGLATIWDADVLIWAASQIVEARDAGIPTSRRLATTPYEILTFTGRGTSSRDYQRLRAARDRLQSTSIATSIRQVRERRLHRFSWINEWTERADGEGRPLSLELILPDWFYAGLINASFVLTLDAAYFGLTGGIERWLYRLVRKHAGRQIAGWQFDFRHLYRKSGSIARFSDFALDLRRIAERQSLPGYRLAISRAYPRDETLFFYPLPIVAHPHGRRPRSPCE